MADKTLKRNVEDFMPIATGHEREELDAELQVMIAIWNCYVVNGAYGS